MPINNIFVNLPVDDLEVSKSFYTALGFTINPLFSDENAACVVISEQIYVMILVKKFFTTFTPRTIVDATSQVEVLNAVGVDSREEVDAFIAAGIAAGGTEPVPAQDLGFMYSRDLADPDGHVWEILWMDPAAAQQGPPAE